MYTDQIQQLDELEAILLPLRDRVSKLLREVRDNKQRLLKVSETDQRPELDEILALMERSSGQLKAILEGIPTSPMATRPTPAATSAAPEAGQPKHRRAKSTAASKRQKRPRGTGIAPVTIAILRHALTSNGLPDNLETLLNTLYGPVWVGKVFSVTEGGKIIVRSWDEDLKRGSDSQLRHLLSKSVGLLRSMREGTLSEQLTPNTSTQIIGQLAMRDEAWNRMVSAMHDWGVQM